VRPIPVADPAIARRVMMYPIASLGLPMNPIDAAGRAFNPLVAQSLCSAQQFQQPYCLPFASGFNRDGSRMLGWI
jgi:hypothetical protein